MNAVLIIITVVQLLPFYDYGSVDETRTGGYNWGYDPVNYNVPEGSYSTNPFDGSVRIREVKQMVQALHNAGIKVIMDVVYNHMFSPDNWFERSVPDYFLRRKSPAISAASAVTANTPTAPSAATTPLPSGAWYASTSWIPSATGRTNTTWTASVST